MNDWKIIFQRSNGTIGNDIFTEETEQKARIAFRNCYRHDIYKIISVEIVNS